MAEIFNETWPGSVLDPWDSGRWDSVVADTSTGLPGAVSSVVRAIGSGATGTHQATGDTTVDFLRSRAKATLADSLMEIRAVGCSASDAPTPVYEFSGNGHNAGGATTVDLDITGTPAAGDVIIAAIWYEGVKADISGAPSGWTQNNDQDNVESSGWSSVFYYRRCDGTEGANPTFTWTFGSSLKARIVAVAYSGLEAQITSLPYRLNTPTLSSGTSTTQLNYNNRTLVDTNTIHVVFGFSTENTTFTPQSGLTEREDVRDTGTALDTALDGSLAVADRDLSSTNPATIDNQVTAAHTGTMLIRGFTLCPPRPTWPCVYVGGSGTDSGTTGSYYAIGPSLTDPAKATGLSVPFGQVQTVTPTALTQVQASNGPSNVEDFFRSDETYSIAVRIVEGTASNYDIQWKIWNSAVAEPAWLEAGTDGTSFGTGFMRGELVNRTLYGDQFGLLSRHLYRETTPSSINVFWNDVTVDDPSLLEVSDSTHSQTADNVDLTQAHILSVEDSEHSHVAEAVTATQAHTLVVDETEHAHATDAPALAQAHVVAVADATHGHAAEGAVLTQAHTLETVGAEHSHAADNVTLSASASLAIDPAEHGHSSDQPSLTQNHELSVAEAEHGHAAESATLSVAATLTTQAAEHTHNAESVTLGQSHVLVSNEAEHSHQADSPTLTQAQTLSVDDAEHGQSADNVAVSTAGSLSVAEATHTHTSDSIALTQAHILLGDGGFGEGGFGEGAFGGSLDVSHDHEADGPTLVVAPAVDDAEHSHQAENVNLTQAHALVVDGAEHGHAAENVDTSQVHNLATQGAEHSHNTDGVALSQSHVLSVDQSEHGHAAESVTLDQAHTLAVDGAEHSHQADNPSPSTEAGLGVSDSEHGHQTDEPTLTQSHVLAVDQASHGHQADSPNPVQSILLDVPDSEHTHSVDNVDLTGAQGLTVADATHTQDSESPQLTQVHILVVDEGAHGHEADNIDLTSDHVLVVDPVEHGHVSEGVVLEVGLSLQVDDGEHGHEADNVDLEYQYLVVQGGTHGHTADSVNVTLIVPRLIQVSVRLIEPRWAADNMRSTWSIQETSERWNFKDLERGPNG